MSAVAAHRDALPPGEAAHDRDDRNATARPPVRATDPRYAGRFVRISSGTGTAVSTTPPATSGGGEKG
jgi:hypothetical protein